MEDFRCLDRRELISDVVIDIYLKYLYKQEFTEEQRKKVHIYTTDFYKLLATPPSSTGFKEIKALTAAEKRYQRVRGVACNNIVNIFEKDFIVFPCLHCEHWFLVIVCFPGLNGGFSLDTGEYRKKDDAKNSGRPAKIPCILVFDSAKPTNMKNLTAITHIRNFLSWEYKTKYNDRLIFKCQKVRGRLMHCPQQSNASDSGLFLLEFFEQFFIHCPFNDFLLSFDASNWFNPNIISEKRERIATVIKDLIAKKTLNNGPPTQPKPSGQAEGYNPDSDDDLMPEEFRKLVEEIVEVSSPSPFQRFENTTELLNYHAKDSGRSAKDPCILVKANNMKNITATTHIRNFLLREHKIKHVDQNVKGRLPHSPQQSNATVCGLFILQFFERFFIHSPFTDSLLSVDASNWFRPNIISGAENVLPEQPDISFCIDAADVQDLDKNVGLHSSNLEKGKITGPPADTEMENVDDESDAVIDSD